MKIFLCYLLAICLTMFVAGISFYSLVRHYVEQQAGQALAREARSFADFMASRPSDRRFLMQPLPVAPIFIFGGRPIESRYAVADNTGSIVSGSSSEDFPLGSKWDETLPGGPNPDQYPNNAITKYGKDIVAGVASIPGSPDSPGTVIVYAKRSALRALNREFMKYLIQGFGVGALVAAGFTVYLTSRIVQPLSLLRDKVREIGQLNFNVGLNLGRKDEIGELALAFDEMAARLAEHDEAMRRLLHNTSHELKTPIMSIRGYAEGIKDGVFEGEEMGFALDVITSECQKLQKQVDELLYLGRLESPVERYEIQVLNLKEVVEEVVSTLKGWAEKEKLCVEVHVPAEVTILADRDKLESLLKNLLSNAIRHASSCISVSARDNVNSGFTEIQVKDDGPGFSPEDLPNVFLPFYRGRSGEVGLGLAIVKAIAEGHKGWAVAENVPDEGAVVRVGFPKHVGKDTSLPALGTK